MSSAKQVVDSTIRRVLMYTSEILISIILLILLSLPLAFTVPMWVQEIVFDVPPSNLAVNPVAWFGAFATFGLTLALGILSFVLGYLFLYRVVPSTQSEEVSPAETKELDESEENDDEEEEERDELVES